MTELGEVLRAEIGQLVLLQVAPDVLDRIELRGVAGEELDFDARMLAGEELPDQLTFVDVGSVPDHQQPAADVAKQMGQKDHHFLTPDGSRESRSGDLSVLSASPHPPQVAGDLG